MKEQSVRCFVLDDNNKILVVKHHETWKWTLPWWRLEKTETIYECILREMKEEFNIQIKLIWRTNFVNQSNINELPVPLSVYNLEYKSLNFWLVDRIDYIFLWKIVWWELKKDPVEIFDYKFCDFQEFIEKLDIYSQFKIILKNNLDLLWK